MFSSEALPAVTRSDIVLVLANSSVQAEALLAATTHLTAISVEGLKFGFLMKYLIKISYSFADAFTLNTVSTSITVSRIFAGEERLLALSAFEARRAFLGAVVPVES